MDLIGDRDRRVSVEELNSSRLLGHARLQADAKNFDDILIVDVDAHHHETEHQKEFLKYVENDVLRQQIMQSFLKGRGNVLPSMTGNQDMGGRVTRYPLRGTEKTDADKIRDVELGYRWMDALSVDYSCLFPTQLLAIGMLTDAELEAELCWSYNRWLTEKIIPASNGRFYSMLALPFSDPDASLRQVETFGDRPGVKGFLVTAVRNLPVHHNSYMKVYRAIEERGLVLAFHSGIHPGEPFFKSLNLNLPLFGVSQGRAIMQRVFLPRQTPFFRPSGWPRTSSG